MKESINWSHYYKIPNGYSINSGVNINNNEYLFLTNSSHHLLVYSLTNRRIVLSIQLENDIKSACLCDFESCKSCICLLLSDYNIKIIQKDNDMFDYRSDLLIIQIFPTNWGLGIFKKSSSPDSLDNQLYILETPICSDLKVSSTELFGNVLAIDSQESLIATVDSNNYLSVYTIVNNRKSKDDLSVSFDNQNVKSLDDVIRNNSNESKSISKMKYKSRKSTSKISKSLNISNSFDSKGNRSNEEMLHDLLGRKRSNILRSNSVSTNQSNSFVENYSTISAYELVKINFNEYKIHDNNSEVIFSGSFNHIGGLSIISFKSDSHCDRFGITRSDKGLNLVHLPTVVDLLRQWNLSEDWIFKSFSSASLTISTLLPVCSTNVIILQSQNSHRIMIVFMIGRESLLSTPIQYDSYSNFTSSIDFSNCLPSFKLITSERFLLTHLSSKSSFVKLNTSEGSYVIKATSSLLYNDEVIRFLSLMLSSMKDSSVRLCEYVLVAVLSSISVNRSFLVISKLLNLSASNSTTFDDDSDYLYRYNWSRLKSNLNGDDLFRYVSSALFIMNWNSDILTEPVNLQLSTISGEYLDVIQKKCHYEVIRLVQESLLDRDSVIINELDRWQIFLERCLIKSNSGVESLRMCRRFLLEIISHYKLSISLSTHNDLSFFQIILKAFASTLPYFENNPTIVISLLPVPLRQLVDLSLASQQREPQSPFLDNILTYIGREDLLFKSSIVSNITCLNDRNEDSVDGLALMQNLADYRFPKDERMQEVCRLLRSSKPHYLRVVRPVEMSDLDFRHKQQVKLLALCRRSLSSSVGRGMLTLSTIQPMPEILQVPPLVLSGRVPPNDSIVSLDSSSASPELTIWPDFHNGVATGLRLNNYLNQNRSAITRNWILYNKSSAFASSKEAEHAGILLALGLKGQLTSLSPNDICEYLTQSNEAITIAILIGCSASKFGSGDALLSKTLCLHLPALLPAKHSDIEISPNVQGSALVGIGLLHCESNHRLMTEFLLSQLSGYPQSNGADAREMLSLCAGWALGMILLGQGTRSTTNNYSKYRSLSDLCIEDRLQIYIDGGDKPADSISNLGLGATVSKTSRVLESKLHINNLISCPGAVIALSLIYIRTNDYEIAARLSLPTTVCDIEAIRPDLLYYRALGRCLILWDDTKPILSWIESAIPKVISRSLSHYFNNQLLIIPLEKSKDKSIGSLNSFASPGSALNAFVCVISGLCMGLGLVLAGTFNLNAKSIIMTYLRMFQRLRDSKLPIAVASDVIMTEGQSKQYRLDSNMLKPLLEFCICQTSLALATVMSGTGDIDCLRIYRELRWRVDELNYGTHLALNMAIGLLFLGGSKCSLKTDRRAVSCLLLSFCPRFPFRTVDNQYHLQPLRHIYTLSAEERILHTVDIDSKQTVFVIIKIDLKNGTSYECTSPCLLPEISTVKAISVSDREINYYKREILMSEYLSIYQNKAIFKDKTEDTFRGFVIVLKAKPKVYLSTFPYDDVNVSIHGGLDNLSKFSLTLTGYSNNDKSNQAKISNNLYL